MSKLVRNQKTRSKKPKPASASSGIALALTAFTVSIQPDYYLHATNVAAIALIVFGIMGLSVELEKISSRQRDNLTEQPKGVGIFNNLGMGWGGIVWTTIYCYFPVIWVNVLTSPILLFGVYGVILGILNWLFITLPKRLSVRTPLKETETDSITLLEAQTEYVSPGL